ncbi:lanosterol 14-alpha demethylase-like [Octopus sinensis]|uniref:Lanosterol 14-alpha demethylase-like n=1 Tax=Octopus sinensis TaxID=2607531 RepID=A0A6P7TV32_9MOLL|nr:lanosterol 14-alpha demethylase-like [Octopus sinensis]
MMGKTITVFLGSQATELFYSKGNDDLNEEEIYNKFTNPIFGKTDILKNFINIKGNNVRNIVFENRMKWISDINNVFSILVYIFPAWFPLKVKNDGRKVDEKAIRALIMGQFISGIQTPSSTAAWLTLFIAHNKKIQLYEEQISVCGKDFKNLTNDDLKEMDLLDRCFKETLRLRPPAALIARRCKNDMVFCFINYDIKKMGVCSYIPFGYGQRRCSGEKFANIQIKITLAYLIQNYEIFLEKNVIPGIDISTVVRSPLNSMIYLKSRNAP